MPLPNRVAVYLAAAAALLGGLAPLVGNLDWESTAGIAAGLAAIAGVVSVWLNNWGKYEARVDETILPADEWPEHEDETIQTAYAEPPVE